MGFLHDCLIGAAGAGSLEALRLWETRAKVSRRRFFVQLRSPLFWFALLAMLAASGFLSWAYNEGKPNVTTIQLAVTGIAIRTLARQIISLKLALDPGEVVLGGDDDSYSLRDFFA